MKPAEQDFLAYKRLVNLSDKCDLPLRFFVDVSTVYDAVVGLYAYLGESPRVPVKQVVTQSKMMASFLPRIDELVCHLLPPHQAELVILLHSRFYLGQSAIYSPRVCAHELLKKIGASFNIPTSDEDGLLQLTTDCGSIRLEHSVLDLVLTRLRSSEDDYKAVDQCEPIRRLLVTLSNQAQYSWFERLAQIQAEGGWLGLDHEGSGDVENLFRTPIFEFAEEVFVRLSGKDNRNFLNAKRDAMALCLLNEMVANCKSSLLSFIPVFVCRRHSSISQAVHEIAMHDNYKDSFTLDRQDDTATTCILSESAFLTHLALNYSSFDAGRKSLPGGSRYADLELIEAGARDDLVNRVAFYRDLCLFEMSGFSRTTEPDGVVATRSLVVNPSSTVGFHEAEREARKRLSQTVKWVQQSIEGIEQLRNVVRGLRLRHNTMDRLNDSGRELMLVQFGFSERVENSLLTYSKMILEAKSERLTELPIQLRMLFGVIHSQRKPEEVDAQMTLDDVYAICTGLLYLSRPLRAEGQKGIWQDISIMLSKYRLEKRSHFKSWWFVLMNFLALYFSKLESSTEEWGVEVRNAFSELESFAAKFETVETSGTYLSGLALCTFRLASRSQLNGNLSGPNESDASLDDLAFDDELLKRAQNIAKLNYASLRNRRRKLYALNQLVYYLARDPRCDRTELLQYARVLINSRSSDSTEWLFYYDDTLGWYYYRLFCLCPTNDHTWSTRRLLLGQAYEEFAHASRSDPHDRDLRARCELISNIAADLETEFEKYLEKTQESSD